MAVAKAEVKAAPREASLVYLGPMCDESPRYAAPRDAPNWLRPDAAAASLDFLLRGADSPALQLFLPPPPATVATAADADADTDAYAEAEADADALAAAAAAPVPAPTAASSSSSSSARVLLPVVLVLPGGGYRHLAPREGAPAAQWLATSLGVIAAVA